MSLTVEQLRELLVKSDLVPAKSFDAAVETAAKEQRNLEDVIVEQGLVPDEYLGQLIAGFYKVPFARLDGMKISDEVLRIVPERVARSTNVISFQRNEKGDLMLAMRDPADLELARLIEKRCNCSVIPHFTTNRGLTAGLAAYSSDLPGAVRTIMEEGGLDENEEEGESRTIRIVEIILGYAYQTDASDIHIEPREREVLVRFRIDGILHDVVTIPPAMLNPIIRRIKILARLRLDEHAAAQDGKFQQVVSGERVDVRVSILPVMEGEKVVMRILAERGRRLDLTDLGLSEINLKKIQGNMRKIFGMILAVGPTGSGKTTTMYGVIKVLNTRDVNIATIEDPIEYAIEGINQIQVNTKTGLTFAHGLRSIARQDPDIIMVGEIRDEETAGIAVNAAMTGHLVLSTLHTNDAATTLPRFRDMKIEPFLIASTINVIIAQRLIRKICTHCIVSQEVTRAALEERLPAMSVARLFVDREATSVNLYRGAGCDQCGGSGYRGRLGLFEVMEMSDRIRELVMANANAKDIKQQAVKEGMTTLLEDGLDKVLAGITSIDEVLRVAGE
ncbi:MAG: GspE/PulE family protein [Patescibacteria group bacterium]|nr:GspE/PulE family protein [Patescibacteria group bacterium]